MFKRNYDIIGFLKFLKRSGWGVRCHVLFIGKFGFCIFWKVKEKS